MWISKWDERLISLSTQHAVDNYWSLKIIVSNENRKNHECKSLTLFTWIVPYEQETKANKWIYFRRETYCLDENFVRVTVKESLLVKSIYFSMSIFISSVYRQYVSYYLWRETLEMISLLSLSLSIWNPYFPLEKIISLINN